MFSKKEKIKVLADEIRQAPELLRINPRQDNSGMILKLFLVVCGLLLVFFYDKVVDILLQKPLNQQMALIGMTLSCVAVVILTLFKLWQARGKLLIITEKGAFIEPFFAERWQDISEYQWNTPGKNRDLLSIKQENPSLFLYNNKGSWPKIYDLANYGIFFTADQVQYLEGLFHRLGIKKREELSSGVL
jgi:hypothetical protein